MTSAPKRYRSIFLSDFHLGAAYCCARRLHAFLVGHEADTIYLVGDIIEANNHQKWPASHVEIIWDLVHKMEAGTAMVYTPGNHDRIFLNYNGEYGNLIVAQCVEHTMVNGEKLLVTHGDDIDRFKSWTLLHFLLTVERLVSRNIWETMRKYLGRTIQHHEVVFEGAMIAYAKKLGYRGVICGHVHKPKLPKLDATNYINCGDWTHHCTAIVEHFDGHFEMITG